MNRKIPTEQDYKNYKGAHTPILWNQLNESWICPSCKRTKFQILRWSKRYTNKSNNGVYLSSYMGFIAPLHKHHDHSEHKRFNEIIICDQCNSADGIAKKYLKIQSQFSFSPREISQFIIATPHNKHKIIFEKAKLIYQNIKEPGQ